jgi:hypothetical protein
MNHQPRRGIVLATSTKIGYSGNVSARPPLPVTRSC